MKIILDGKHLNIKFSSAHFIIEHEKCSKLHGHNFYVTVEIEGEIIDEKGFVIDFLHIKNMLKSICNNLDHKVLVPERYANIVNDYVEIKTDKIYKIPREDVILLPVNNVTSEELAKFIFDKLKVYLKEYKNVKWLKVIVEEEPGQGASIEGRL